MVIHVSSYKESVLICNALFQALIVKQNLQQKAVERRLLPPKRTSFYRRQLRPFFVHRFKGSSSEEEEADEEMQRRRGKQARRAKRQAQKAEQQFMRSKIHTDTDERVDKGGAAAPPSSR